MAQNAEVIEVLEEVETQDQVVATDDVFVEVVFDNINPVKYIFAKECIAHADLSVRLREYSMRRPTAKCPIHEKVRLSDDLYHLMGHLSPSPKDPGTVRQEIKLFVEENGVWCGAIAREYLARKGLTLEEWLRHVVDPAFLAPPDELAVTILSRMFSVDMVILTASSEVHTFHTYDDSTPTMHFAIWKGNPDGLRSIIVPVMTVASLVTLHAEYDKLRPARVPRVKRRLNNAPKPTPKKHCPIPVASGEARIKAEKRAKARRLVKKSKTPKSKLKCGLKFKSMGLPRRRQAGRRFFCRRCDFRLSTRQFLDQHVREVHGVKFICQACYMECGNQAALTRHISGVHQQAGPWECALCPSKFLYKSYLDAHSKVHNDQRLRFKCPRRDCEKEYFNFTDLRRHQKICGSKKVLKCKTCGNYETSNPKHLQEHARSHTHHYVCSCGFVAQYRPKMLRHRKKCPGAHMLRPKAENETSDDESATDEEEAA